MRRYLVVANQTLGSEQLTERLDECMAAGPSRFHLVVPATEAGLPDPVADGGGGVPISSHKMAVGLARRRLQKELARLREAGAEADGEVVNPNPVSEIRKIAEREEIDEIIVSTLPRRFSRWQALDLPHRIQRATKLPVTQVSGKPGPEP